ncbi:hypothetical protein, partial [Salinivibrio sp. VYel6]|uniref:hypothetical protein n=1 Tax=Salinivibrio sp. VYel6 TaxID=2490493 RepID=UPI001C12BBB9
DNRHAPAVHGIGDLSECHVDRGDGTLRLLYYSSATSTNNVGNIFFGMTRPRNIARPMAITI